MVRISVVVNSPSGHVKFPLDQDDLDPRHEVSKWFTTFPLNQFTKKKEEKGELNKRPTSYSMVILATPSPWI